MTNANEMRSHNGWDIIESNSWTLFNSHVLTKPFRNQTDNPATINAEIITTMMSNLRCFVRSMSSSGLWFSKRWNRPPVAKTSEPEISKERTIASILRQFSLKVSPDHSEENCARVVAFKASKISALRSHITTIIRYFCINLYLFEYIRYFAILQRIRIQGVPFRRKKYS